MSLSNKCKIAALLICLSLMSVACRHQAVSPKISTTTATRAETISLQPDQVNTAGWDGAWTNLLNDAEQSFAPSLPKLVAVEVELVVGNPGAAEDELTLTVLDRGGQTLAIVAENVPSADCDHVTFVMPSRGIEVSPGQLYWLKLTGGFTFGWKYVARGYKDGEATFNGKPLLAGARSTFLFRTFGAQ